MAFLLILLFLFLFLMLGLFLGAMAIGELFEFMEEHKEAFSILFLIMFGSVVLFLVYLAR